MRMFQALRQAETCWWRRSWPVSYTHLVVCDPSDPSALTAEDLPILFSQYEKLAEAMLARKKEGRPITFYHYMIDLNHGPVSYTHLDVYKRQMPQTGALSLHNSLFS